MATVELLCVTSLSVRETAFASQNDPSRLGLKSPIDRRTGPAFAILQSAMEAPGPSPGGGLSGLTLCPACAPG